MTLDLNEAEAATALHEAGVEVEILDPATREPTGAVIVIAGPDSRRARRARQAAIRELLAKGGEIDDSEMLTAILSRMVIGWSGIRRGDHEIECTQAAAAEVFTRLPWIESQCETKANVRANFTKG